MVSSQNVLNDLTAKEWLINTKSVWLCSDYFLDFNDTPSNRYIRNLILFFTKKGSTILNPNNDKIIKEIAYEEKRTVKTESTEKVDFILLEEQNHYSDYLSYKSFIDNKIRSTYHKYYSLLKDRKYLCVKIKDFYLVQGSYCSELINFHYDLTKTLMQIGFSIKGIIIWVPKDYDRILTGFNDPNSSIIHEYILIFRKEEKKINKPITLDQILKSNNITTINEKIFYPSLKRSKTPIRDKYKSHHPATFPEPDIVDLISFYTDINSKPKILDPFCGVGSTLLACNELNVEGWGIELTKKWVKLTQERFKVRAPGFLKVEDASSINFINDTIFLKEKNIQRLVIGDTREKIKLFPDNYFDLIITSPPYWGILTKKIDHKTRKERIDKGLETKYTDKIDSTFTKDLANILSYKDFIGEMGNIYSQCFDKLKNKRYMIVIVSDFRNQSDFYLYHATTTDLLRKNGFKLISLVTLYQENKRLYPYGYPYAYVSNIHHQFIIITKKEI